MQPATAYDGRVSRANEGAKRRNLDRCMTGTSTCDPLQLTVHDAQSVAGAP